MLPRLGLSLLALTGSAAWSSSGGSSSFRPLATSLLKTTGGGDSGGGGRGRRGAPYAAARMVPIAEPEKPADQVADEMARAQRLIDYLDASPEPFHVTATTAAMLEAAGFTELSEKELWGRDGLLRPGGKYYYIRNRSCLVAFTVGGACTAAELAFKVIGAHTDSPALKVKPRSKRAGSGLAQLNVECYGGGLWHTWFDRDLSLAGRVVVRRPSSSSSSNNNKVSFEQRLVHVKEPILRVPNLCIHLQSAGEREAFKVNKEDHLQPILCGQVRDSLGGSAAPKKKKKKKKEEEEEEGEGEKHKEGEAGEGGGAVEDEEEEEEEDEEPSDWSKGQDAVLMGVLRDELKLSEGEEIVDFELTLYDTQGAAFGGAKKEFVNGGRLDNLASCFVATEALIDHASDEGGALGRDKDVSVITLFDHEEVGSSSAVGAGSPIMNDAVERITQALAMTAAAAESKSKSESESESGNDGTEEGNKKGAAAPAAAPATPARVAMSGRALLGGIGGLDGEVRRSALARSMVLSVDMAHAVHPNYASKHEKAHGPLMNAGVVIKSNSNQRYATNGVTGFLTRELGRREGVPVQEFVVRNDCPCGSTIGPIISTATGMRVVDLGMPQLSMHSCREMMGRADLTLASKLFRRFLADFREIDEQLGD